MSHAIIRAGGKQFLVKEGQTIRVPSLEAEAGSSIELETLLTSGEAAAKATVVSHGKDQKIVVFKKKRRKQYKRTRGHRQGFTELKIDSIG
ncbi:MAG TPA: 50S ribosomal protein L21 [Pyrinomonadaceae bacterium]|jgi:large subunit ribosomal protein L21